MTGQPAVRARLEPARTQTADVVVDRGFHPDTIVARAGEPLRLVFRRNDLDACTERVIFSSPRIDRHLDASRPTIIELPAQPPGEVRFTCGMGRYRGRIQLVEGDMPMLGGRLRGGRTHVEKPLGVALLLWLCTLPLIALLGAFAVGGTWALAAAGVALIACVAACLWAFNRSARPAA